MTNLSRWTVQLEKGDPLRQLWQYNETWLLKIEGYSHVQPKISVDQFPVD